MQAQYFLILDCGATSLRAVAISEEGKILSVASFPNAPRPQEENPEFLIWDIEEMWDIFCKAIRKVVGEVGKGVRAVAVTTFGADGAPVKKDGTLTYPVISWQCSRTSSWVTRIEQLINPWEAFEITGYQVLPFNTLLKFLWLKENAPQALEEADTFLMMPGLLSFRLCGEMFLDFTSASTSMLLDLQERKWSSRLLDLVGLDPGFFPPLVYPGEVIGKVHDKASQETQIPVGTPVVVCGHDTQFALVGSLAGEEDLILSSGTWEIAAFRSKKYLASRKAFELGMLIELDAEDGYWNPQMLMIAGGVVEWVRRNLFSDVKDDPQIYQIMIQDALSVPPGSNGVVVVPSFMPSGPNKPQGTEGTVLGLGLTSSRAQLFRATLEGLSFQLRQAKEAIEEVYHFSPRGLRVVGGGARNELWNRIRADVLNLPVTTTSCEEATVLGASLFCKIGVGDAKNLSEAKETVKVETRCFNPSPAAGLYEEFYREYQKVPYFLAPFYKRRKK